MIKEKLTRLIQWVFPDRSIRDILLREATPSAVFKIYFVLITFLSSIVFVRTMGSKYFGIFSHVTAIIDVLKIPVVFGLPVLVMRETTKNIMDQNWGGIKGVWNWASKYILISALGIIVLGIIFLITIGVKIDLEYKKSLFWGILLIPFLAFSSLRGGQLRGINKIVLSQFPEQILFPTLQVVFMILLGLLLPGKISASTGMVVFVSSGIIVFLIGLWFLAKNAPPELKPSTPVYNKKKWFFSTLNLAGINGLDIVNRQVSLIIAGLLISNSSEIGYYKIAINFSFLASVGLQIANSVFEPKFAALFLRNDKVELQNFATLSARAVLLFNFAITSVLIVFGKPILSLAYGAEFQAAFLPLLILLIGQFINTATGTASNILNMAGKEKLTLKTTASGTAINLSLNFLLTPLFGVIGSAIGTSISTIIMNIMLWRIVQRELGINSMAINFRQK